MLIALHGFLGLASDWSHFRDRLPSITAVDLWDDLKRIENDRAGLPGWTALLHARVREAAQDSQQTGKPWVLGYSMGGRLAMQAVVENPTEFGGAIFVSAHPGLTSEAERTARLQADKTWAYRFLLEPWSSVLQDWDAQEALRPGAAASSDSAIALTRNESDFNCESLARGLTEWSLGLQPDFRAQLAAVEIPTLFVSGAEDAKFTALMRDLKLNSKQKHAIIPGAGHRVPWETPKEFCDLVKDFMTRS